MSKFISYSISLPPKTWEKQVQRTQNASDFNPGLCSPKPKTFLRPLQYLRRKLSENLTKKLKFFQWFLFNMVTSELFKGEKEEREWKIRCLGPSSCTLHTHIHIHIWVLISFSKKENNGYEDLNNLPKATQQEKKMPFCFRSVSVWHENR